MIGVQFYLETCTAIKATLPDYGKFAHQLLVNMVGISSWCSFPEYRVDNDEY